MLQDDLGAKSSEPVVLGLGTFAGLFADMPDGVMVSSTDRRILWMNASAEKMFGYRNEDLRGRETKSLYANSEKHAMNAKHLVAMRQPASTSHFFIDFMRKNGQVFEAEVTGSAIRGDQGELLGYLGVIRDVSEANAVEKAIHALYEISSNHGLSSERKLEEILNLGCEHFNLPTGIVSKIVGDTYTVMHSVSALTDIPQGMQFDLGRTYCCHTLAADAPLGFHDAKSSTIAEHPCYADFGLDAYLGIPLIVDGARYGTLNFSGPIPTNEFSETDYDLMKLFAAWVAQEISAGKARQALEHEADTDPLTGCFNRRAWMREAHDLLYPMLVDPTALPEAKALIAFDLDEFKAINDAHGHAIGDEVLKSVVRLCQDDPALEDQPLGRLGGEEFFILCHGAAAKNVAEITEALRARLARMVIPVDGKKLQCTASFGICHIDDPYMGLEAAMNKADMALYEAKFAGRNQVFDANDLGLKQFKAKAG